MLINLIRSWIRSSASLNSVPSPASMMTIVCATLFGVTSLSATASSSDQAPPIPNATILLYHHVSNETPPSTSISPSDFKAHMEYLKANHTVVPLQDVVAALKANTPLPDKAVAITFDDGFANILENAHPVLTKMDFPYTIFINPDEIDVGPKQLTWEQVKRMLNDGVTFANHTLDHLHMLNDEQSLGESEWLDKVWQNVASAERKINDQLGVSLKYLAYPFGEYNLTLAAKLKEEGYVGFGQHSGAVGPHSDLQALPRFPAAGPYANLNSLKTKLNSLAMPVMHSSLQEPRLTGRKLSDPITLTIESDDMRTSQVTCFFKGDAIETRSDGNTVSFRINDTLPIGRSRINCTAPSIKAQGRYYWYSQPFFIADKAGRYPD